VREELPGNTRLGRAIADAVSTGLRDCRCRAACRAETQTLSGERIRRMCAVVGNALVLLVLGVLAHEKSPPSFSGSIAGTGKVVTHFARLPWRRLY
jgi:hypothetical protein